VQASQALSSLGERGCSGSKAAMEEAHLHEQEEVGVLRLGSLPGTLPDVLVRNVDTLDERNERSSRVSGSDRRQVCRPTARPHPRQAAAAASSPTHSAP
jgi:hypothetical protein